MKKQLCSMIFFLSMVFMFSACGSDTVNTSGLIVPQENESVDLFSAENTIDIQKEKEVTQPVLVDSVPHEEEPEAEESQEVIYSYIANKNTWKLHNLNCYSVNRMKESNKIYLDCTRNEALLEGYIPCENCKP